MRFRTWYQNPVSAFRTKERPPPCGRRILFGSQIFWAIFSGTPSTSSTKIRKSFYGLRSLFVRGFAVLPRTQNIVWQNLGSLPFHQLEMLRCSMIVKRTIVQWIWDLAPVQVTKFTRGIWIEETLDWRKGLPIWTTLPSIRQRDRRNFCFWSDKVTTQH